MRYVDGTFPYDHGEISSSVTVIRARRRAAFITPIVRGTISPVERAPSMLRRGWVETG
jgi:hypothetical protein